MQHLKVKLSPSQNAGLIFPTSNCKVLTRTTGTQQSAPPSHTAAHFNDNGTFKPQTTAWLAQLVERKSAVWEVEGSSPRLDQHSGS